MGWLAGEIPESKLLMTPPQHVVLVEEAGTRRPLQRGLALCPVLRPGLGITCRFGNDHDGGAPYSLLWSRDARGQVAIHRTQEERGSAPRSLLPA